MTIRLAYTNTALRCTAWMLLSLTLSTCALFENTPPPQAKIHKIVRAPHMDEFITQLSLVQLMLLKDSTDTTIKPHLNTIEKFTSRKQKKPISQPVILLSYTLGEQTEIHQLVVPFTLSQAPDFTALHEAEDIFSGMNYTLHDVHPRMLTIPPVKPLKFSDDAQKTKEIIDNELHMLLANSTPLNPLEEAQAQMHLLQFFIDHHVRDAAYLAAENAKQSLADAENKHSDAEAIKTLSGQLKTLENQLHQTMPFSIF